MLSNNLIYYNISQIKAAYGNACLVTTEGEVLIFGMNDCCQLAMPKEVADALVFFPEFSKID